MTIDDWAQALMAARGEHRAKPAVASRMPNPAAADAYAVQKSCIEHWQASDPVVGIKSALTNDVARRLFNWDSSVSGVLLRSMAVAPGDPVASASFHRGAIETEIGFRLAIDVTAPITPAQVSDCIDATMPMIELADTGFDGSPTPLDLIAGNAAAAGFICGAAASTGDINAVEVTLARDGEPLHLGKATDALGDQFQAVAWLANQCLAQGYALTRGLVLMTGSLGQIQPMKPGNYIADYGDFGHIEFVVR